jgi:hypothetical protein
MKIKNIILSSLLIPITTLGSFREIPNIRTPDLNKLKLNQEVYLSDTNGLINIKTVSLLQVGDNIRVYRPDGTLYTGIVTKTEESDGLLHIIGNINNKEDAQFGFVFAKGGHFAGAIVEKKNDRIYALELSEAHKGFVFLYTTKYDKKLI